MIELTHGYKLLSMLKQTVVKKVADEKSPDLCKYSWNSFTDLVRKSHTYVWLISLRNE